MGPRLSKNEFHQLSTRLNAERGRLFELDSLDGWELSRAATSVVDDVVLQVVDSLGVAPEVQPVALGSYGRGDLCPWSDVDLMFLCEREDDFERERVDGVFYALWDQGFQVGHAVRTVGEALSLAREDHTVLSSLLEYRPIRPGAPIEALQRGLAAIFRDGQRVERFIDEKVAEARDRHERFGETVFMLEPNVKESPGGLRDLHLALWVARARWKVDGFQAMLSRSFLSEREAVALMRAESFLIWARWHMHRITGRRQDHLRFDLQEALGALLSPDGRAAPDLDERRRTERFMRAYYFHAGQVEQHAVSVADRARSSPTGTTAFEVAIRPTSGGFKLWKGALTVSNRNQLLEDPSAVVRLFRVAQEEALPVYSYTKNLVREAARRFDAETRRRNDVLSEFFWLLEDPKSDGRVLREFHELGVLRAIIPEFRRVTSRWQHSLYHIYTVDVHSIIVLENLKRLRRGDFASELIELTRWMGELLRPHVVYFAGLLHDVGKGWPKGDHSIRGEKVARVVGERFEEAELIEWGSRETEDLAWLVREHLLMSDLSQRRDVSDPDLLQDFASRCETLERLRMLHILTFADMRGTSPKVWTSWKGSLLAQLSANAAGLLMSSADAHERLQRRRRRLQHELVAEASRRPELGVHPDEVQEFVGVMPPRYIFGFTPRRMVRHVEMWRDVSRLGGFSFHVSALRREKLSRVTVVCPDRPGLLALLAGALAANRLEVKTAQIFSIDAALTPPKTEGYDPTDTYDLVAVDPERTAERLALDVLNVTDERGELCDEATRWRQFRADLEAVLFGGQSVDELLDARRPVSSLMPRAMPEVPVEVAFSNEESDEETIIDVWGPDRHTLLYQLARALTDSGLTIGLAKISSQGSRVADGFYVRDAASGGKITDVTRMKRIKAALVEAFQRSSERPRPLSEMV